MSATAFIVLAHADPRQCTRLVRALLKDDTAHIFLHVDLKSKHDFSTVTSLDPARVHAVGERYTVTWSGFNMVRATLAAMKQALAFPVDFDYVVLLSGMDYPIRHPLELREYLRTRPYRQHINRVDVRESTEHYLKVVERYNFRDAWLPARTPDKVLRKLATLALTPIRRTLPVGTICTGSSWWAMTAECARYVVAFAEIDREYAPFFRYVLASDEYYFHTVIQNSKFLPEAVPITPYQGRGMWRTANLHVIHPSLTRIYALDHFDEIMGSGRYFVRKVTSEISGPLLDRIDAELYR
jgi:hypothetical protein